MNEKLVTEEEWSLMDIQGEFFLKEFCEAQFYPKVFSEIPKQWFLFHALPHFTPSVGDLV